MKPGIISWLLEGSMSGSGRSTKQVEYIAGIENFELVEYVADLTGFILT